MALGALFGTGFALGALVVTGFALGAALAKIFAFGFGLAAAGRFGLAFFFGAALATGFALGRLESGARLALVLFDLLDAFAVILRDFLTALGFVAFAFFFLAAIGIDRTPF